MNFSDDKIRVVIRDLQVGKNKDTGKYYEDAFISFKAYLEKSDLQVKFVDETIKYTPLGYSNNTQLMKTNYTIDYSFNLFSENENEAAENYFKVLQLLYLLKPIYAKKNNQYIPDAKNLFGLIGVTFDALFPLTVEMGKETKLYVTNFNYQINKDLGYAAIPKTLLGVYMQNFSTDETSIDKIEAVPRETSLDEAVSQGTISKDEAEKARQQAAQGKDYEIIKKKTEITFDSGLVEGSIERVLVPIGYKIDLSGKVLLSLKDSLNRTGYKNLRPDPGSGNEWTLRQTLNDMLDSLGTQRTALIQLTKKFFLQISGKTEEDWNSFPDNEKALAVLNLKAAFIDQKIIDINGDVIVDPKWNFSPDVELRKKFKQAYVDENLKSERLIGATSEYPESLDSEIRALAEKTGRAYTREALAKDGNFTAYVKN